MQSEPKQKDREALGLKIVTFQIPFTFCIFFILLLDIIEMYCNNEMISNINLLNE